MVQVIANMLGLPYVGTVGNTLVYDTGIVSTGMGDRQVTRTVNRLFKKYKDTLQAIQDKYPGTVAGPCYNSLGSTITIDITL